jgi:hypothetical protein
MPRPLLLTSAAVLAFALPALGCKALKTGATQTFAREFSCPEERVAALERSDVTGSSVMVGPPGAGLTPPPEVSRDPARLARWKADQIEEQRGARDVYDGFTVFEVSGCDHRAFYACKRAAKVNGNADPIGCFKATHPPP